MKILFIEDSEPYIGFYKENLAQLGEITHFKSSNIARCKMSQTKFDIIVCDHSILRFEDEHHQASGIEIYGHLRQVLDDEETPFIHFSVTPCPEKYYGHKEDDNFHCLTKNINNKLLKFIKEVLK